MRRNLRDLCLSLSLTLALAPCVPVSMDPPLDHTCAIPVGMEASELP